MVADWNGLFTEVSSSIPHGDETREEVGAEASHRGAIWAIRPVRFRCRSGSRRAAADVRHAFAPDCLFHCRRITARCARVKSEEVDPVELRLSDRTYETVRMEGFFGAIRDAMPDSWGRRVIDRRATGRVLREFDYLLDGPDDRIGALGFGLTVKPSPTDWQGNTAVDLVDLQRGAESLLDGRAQPGEAGVAEAEALLRLGTSVGGARPKTVVRDGDDLWIAKFSRPDERWNLPRAEHGTLGLAETCGLAVNDSRIVTVGDRDVLLVRRSAAAGTARPSAGRAW